LFSTQLMKKKKVKARMLAKKAPGFEHLHFDRLVHPETGANIHLVGIRSASPNDVPKVMQEISFCLREAKPDTVVVQFCEDRYNKQMKDLGEEPIATNGWSVLDPRHFSNSVRMAVLLINRVTTGPRFNEFMFSIMHARELKMRVVLGDIPYKVLDYRIAVEQSMGETWNYFQRTTRKERKMGDYPGASRLIVGTEPVQHVFNWVQTNAKKVAAQERLTYNFAEKVALEHNVGKSFLENTTKSMAHACFHAEGKTVVCFCSPLAMDGISQQFGKTSPEQIRALRRKPQESIQNTKILSSWVFSKWNAYCAFMYGVSYLTQGFDEQMVFMWCVALPTLYPTCWSLLSFRARRRIQSFQRCLIKSKKAQPASSAA